MDKLFVTLKGLSNSTVSKIFDTAKAVTFELDPEALSYRTESAMLVEDDLSTKPMRKAKEGRAYYHMDRDCYMLCVRGDDGRLAWARLNKGQAQRLHERTNAFDRVS